MSEITDLCLICGDRHSLTKLESICATCAVKNVRHTYEWISVKNRLPIEKEIGSIFIATIFCPHINKSNVVPLHFIGGEWFDMFNEDPIDDDFVITHWMELPEAPK